MSKIDDILKMAREIKKECINIGVEECDCGKCKYADGDICICEEIFGNSPCNWETFDE